MKQRQKINTRGFSLIELLLVLAIIGILAATILVAVSSQRAKAQRTRALAELSGALQPLMLCSSDGGNLNNPNGTSGGSTRAYCDLSSNYGFWPQTGSGSELSNFGTYTANMSGNWYFSISDSGVKICCNRFSGKCKELTPNTAVCNSTTSF